MKTFIKAKLKKSDDSNIDKFRVAENITELHIILKLIFKRIIIPKFMMIRQNVKNYYIFIKDHIVATLLHFSQLYQKLSY